MKPVEIVIALTLAATGAVAAAPYFQDTMQDEPVGYEDTPLLPDGVWRVHDKHRPVPEVVTPGECGAAPSDAIVLFDGKQLDAWTSNGEDAKWAIEEGALVVNGTGAIQTRQEFGDIQLHLEWASPLEVQGESQGRGNSGVFFMNRYEIQILDSYRNRTYADGQAAAMYGQRPPDVNATLPPGEWNVYDVVFRAPRFAEGELVTPARVTLFHNGVLVHDAQEFVGATTHRELAKYAPHAETGPIQLQDHGNPVRFRNIWVRALSR